MEALVRFSSNEAHMCCSRNYKRKNSVNYLSVFLGEGESRGLVLLMLNEISESSLLDK